MKKFIAILLTFAFCWGGYAITPQQIQDALRSAQQQGLPPGARIAQIRGGLAPLLGLSTDQAIHDALIGGIWKAFVAGGDTSPYVPEIQAVSTIPDPAPVAAPQPAPVAPPHQHIQPVVAGQAPIAAPQQPKRSAPAVAPRNKPKPPPPRSVSPSLRTRSPSPVGHHIAIPPAPPPPPPAPPVAGTQASAPRPSLAATGLLDQIRQGPRLRNTNKSAVEGTKKTNRANTGLAASLQTAIDKRREGIRDSESETDDDEEW